MRNIEMGLKMKMKGKQNVVRAFELLLNTYNSPKNSALTLKDVHILPF
jgi:hypothetical protein